LVAAFFSVYSYAYKKLSQIEVVICFQKQLLPSQKSCVQQGSSMCRHLGLSELCVPSNFYLISASGFG
jgi:hypothetical protein